MARISNDELNSLHIVCYDGVCGLCNGVVQVLLRQDKHHTLMFMSLQSDLAKTYFAKTTINPDALESIIYVRKGKIFQKSSAVLHIANDLGGAWRLTQCLWVLPTFIRDGVYDLIARYRYRLFGRYDTCIIPSPTVSSRFLDLS